MKKLFLTGLTENLGQRILECAARSDFELHGFEPEDRVIRKSLSTSNSRLNLHQITPGDLGELESLWSAMDCVIHSDIIRHFTQYNVKDVFPYNVGRTRDYVNACLEAGVEKMVFISSASVFRKPRIDGHTINENTDLLNLSGSGLSNSILRAEMEVWRGAAEGLNVTVLNPGVITDSEKENSASGVLRSYFSKHPLHRFPGINGFVTAQRLAECALASIDSDFTNARYIISDQNSGYQDMFADVQSMDEPSLTQSLLKAGLLKRIKWLKYKLSSDRQALSYPSYRLLFEKYRFDTSRMEKAFADTFTTVAGNL